MAYSRYEKFQQKRWHKKAIKEGSNYKRKKNKGMFKAVGVFKRLKGAIGVIPLIIIMLFIWKRYDDILNYFKLLFNRSSDYFKGNVSELPKDREYYVGVVSNLYNSINGLDWLGDGNKELYDILKELNVYELQYVNDIYKNPEHPDENLVAGLKDDIQKGSHYYNKIKALFNNANISF